MLFDRFVYTPLHTVAEGWIHSGAGQQIDGFINTITGSCAIGDGAAGTGLHKNCGQPAPQPFIRSGRLRVRIAKQASDTGNPPGCARCIGKTYYRLYSN